MNDIRQGTCPLCGHNEIIQVRPTARVGVYLDRREHASSRLWSFTCRRCSYTQMFADDAAKIPIGAEHGTQLVTGPPPQPFR